MNVIIEGIDGCGKSSSIDNLPYPSIKYPNNQEIKDAILKYYKFLARSGKELHDEVRKTIYQNIHDLYDMDFRRDIQIPDENVVIFDRYFISNVVYAKMNDVPKQIYYEEHKFTPDLVIFLKVRDYTTYKRKFIERGDELQRDPAVLFKEVQYLYQAVLKELLQKKLIKRYIIIEALQPDTNAKIQEAITNML